jgi:hypothetical protein
VPAAKGQKLGQLAASVDAMDRSDLFYACDAAVRRALEMAGGRLVPGPSRARYPVPRHELHVHVRPELERVPSLLAGAWQHVREQASGLSVDPDALEQLLAGYCAELLTRGMAHEPGMLWETLARARRQLVS